MKRNLHSEVEYIYLLKILTILKNNLFNFYVCLCDMFGLYKGI